MDNLLKGMNSKALSGACLLFLALEAAGQNDLKLLLSFPDGDSTLNFAFQPLENGGGMGLFRGPTDQNYHVKFDSTGQCEWVKRSDMDSLLYLLSDASSTTTPDGGLVVVGGFTNVPIGNGFIRCSYYALKIDPYGDVEWMKRYDHPNTLDIAYSGAWVMAYGDGSILVLNKWQDSLGHYESNLMKLDPTGAPLWSNAFDLFSLAMSSPHVYATPMPDGGCVVRIDDYDSWDNVQAFRVDGSGQLRWTHDYTTNDGSYVSAPRGMVTNGSGSVLFCSKREDFGVEWVELMWVDSGGVPYRKRYYPDLDIALGLQGWAGDTISHGGVALDSTGTNYRTWRLPSSPGTNGSIQTEFQWLRAAFGQSGAWYTGRATTTDLNTNIESNGFFLMRFGLDVGDTCAIAYAVAGPLNFTDAPDSLAIITNFSCPVTGSMPQVTDTVASFASVPPISTTDLCSFVLGENPPVSAIARLWPNPVFAGEDVEVMMRSERIELLDQQGRVLAVGSPLAGSDVTRIATIGCAPGLYTVRAQNHGIVRCMQLVVM